MTPTADFPAEGLREHIGKEPGPTAANHRLPESLDAAENLIL